MRPDFSGRRRPARHLSVFRSRLLPMAELSPYLPADYSKWDVDTLTTYLKEKNLQVPANTPSRDELSVPP